MADRSPGDVCWKATGGHLIFWCPGCNSHHAAIVDGSRGWTWNGSFTHPTISPSILVKGTVPITDDEHARIMRGEPIQPRDLICHSFVRDGMIEYLSDSTHSLAGQTVPLPVAD